MVNEARYLAWYCELKTRLSDIVSHVRNNYRQILTTAVRLFFYNVILNCFQNHSHLLKSQKQTKVFFFVLNWTINSWRGIAQKMASKSSTKQDGEATTGEVPGSIVTHTEEKINTFKRRHGLWKKKSTSTSVCRWQSWYLEKYKTELNLNSISKTFQGTYHISIATLNFQCFRLDTSFLSVLPPKR